MLTIARVTRPERVQQLGGHVWRASDGDSVSLQQSVWGRSTHTRPPHPTLNLLLHIITKQKARVTALLPAAAAEGGGLIIQRRFQLLLCERPRFIFY